MVGLHVQLDVEYASDDKLIEAGPLAELLYVRSLCFAKRTLKDGKITHGQLTAVAIGIPSPVKQARRLVDVGAWTATSDGYRITNWLKRNKSAAQVRAEADRRSRDSIAKNHKRWHVDEHKLNPTCPLCYPELDHSTDPNRDAQRDTLTECTEEEVEAETQPEAEAEAEAQSTPLPDPAAGTKPASPAKGILADALRAILGPAVTDTEQQIRRRTVRELGEAGATVAKLEQCCTEYHRRWPDALLTDNALRKYWTALTSTHPTVPLSEPEPPPPNHPPHCHCEGGGNGTFQSEVHWEEHGVSYAAPCPGPDEPHPQQSYLDSLPNATVHPIRGHATA